MIGAGLRSAVFERHLSKKDQCYQGPKPHKRASVLRARESPPLAACSWPDVSPCLNAGNMAAALPAKLSAAVVSGFFRGNTLEVFAHRHLPHSTQLSIALPSFTCAGGHGMRAQSQIIRGSMPEASLRMTSTVSRSSKTLDQHWHGCDLSS